MFRVVNIEHSRSREHLCSTLSTTINSPRRLSCFWTSERWTITNFFFLSALILSILCYCAMPWLLSSLFFLALVFVFSRITWRDGECLTRLSSQCYSFRARCETSGKEKMKTPKIYDSGREDVVGTFTHASLSGIDWSEMNTQMLYSDREQISWHSNYARVIIFCNTTIKKTDIYYIYCQCRYDILRV